MIIPFPRRKVYIMFAKLDRCALFHYISISKRGTASLLHKGGDNITVSEVIALLNLLAVVIFGVINITKKK